LILFWLQIPVKIKNNSTDLCFYENEGGVWELFSVTTLSSMFLTSTFASASHTLAR
jgi:hypothetical protein